MVRRMLAITLLIAFGFPLVLPLYAATADPESSLPACCRSQGSHHCAMVHLNPGAPALQAPPCASYPAPSIAPPVATASLIVAPLSAEIGLQPAPLVTIPARAARSFSFSANLKRGPPTRLA